MKIDIEQVEKLKAHANVSYEEAKAALEEAEGDLLDAMIILEKKGKTKERTAKTAASANAHEEEAAPEPEHRESYEYERTTSSFGDQMNKIWKALLRLFHLGNINHFDVYKNGNNVLSVPVNILILALAIFFWVTLPLLIVFLFLGYKYRFSGPNLGKRSVNDVMDSASETAENLKRSANEAAEEYKEENKRDKDSE